MTDALAAATTMTEALDAAVARDPDHPLLRTAGRETTVGEIDAGSRGVAGALRAWGIEPGDRCAVMMGNVPEFSPAGSGSSRAGGDRGAGPLRPPRPAAGAHPRRVRRPPPVLRRRVRAAARRPRAARRWSGSSSAATAAEAPAGPRRAESVAEFLAAGRPAALASLEVADAACILYTLGHHRPLEGRRPHPRRQPGLGRANVEMMATRPDDVLYTAFPLFHVNAKFTSLPRRCSPAARLVLDERFSASSFWPRMREKGVTAFNYMGALLTILDKASRAPTTDRDHGVVRCLRRSACPATLWEDFERRFGVRAHEHYGMTETGIATRTDPDRAPGRLDRPGRRTTTRSGWPTSDDRRVRRRRGRRDPGPPERARR